MSHYTISKVINGNKSIYLPILCHPFYIILVDIAVFIRVCVVI